MEIWLLCLNAATDAEILGVQILRSGFLYLKAAISAGIHGVQSLEICHLYLIVLHTTLLQQLFHLVA